MVQLLDQTLPSLPSIPRDESYDWASPNVAGLMWTVPRLLPLGPCPVLWGERCETEEVPAVTSDLNPVTPRPRLSLANINWSSDSGLGLRPADCGKCGGQHQDRHTAHWHHHHHTTLRAACHLSQESHCDLADTRPRLPVWHCLDLDVSQQE